QAGGGSDMRRLGSLGIGIACGAGLLVQPCAAAAQEAAKPAQTMAEEMEARLPGEPGAALTLDTPDGETIDLAQSYGRKPVYIEMWATWCTACRAQMPHLEEAYSRWRDDFTVVAVATGFDETVDEVRAFVERQGITAPVAVDDGRLA